MTGKQTFLIIGASLAGAKAAETLRNEGFEGRVVLVGAEEERPYERPPLSKDYLRGEAGRERVYVHGEDFYAEHDIELRPGRTAVDTIASLREVALDDGERLRHDRLMLATGAEPRRLAIPGGELDGVHYLRSVGDSDVLRGRLDRGGAVVVVGAGWIGAEVAASARQRGLEVTVVAPDAVPLERVLGREVGDVYRDIHTEHGVRMLLGTRVEAFEGDGAVERVRTSDGRHLECDFVVVGIGVEPRTQLAAQAGLAIGDGSCRRASADHCARCVRRRRRGRRPAPVLPAADPRRALGQRAAAGAGGRAQHARRGRALRLPAVLLLRPVRRRDGVLGLRARLGPGRVCGDPASREFIAFWLAGDRVQAGMNTGVWDVVDPIQRLIRDRVAVDDWRLSDPDVPLEQLVPIEGARPHEPPRATSGRGRLDLARHAVTRATRQRRLRGVDRRQRRHGRDVEPDDLRQGDHRLGPL